jgi:hypothetical protein
MLVDDNSKNISRTNRRLDANIDVLKNIFWTYDFNLKRSLFG